MALIKKQAQQDTACCILRLSETSCKNRRIGWGTWIRTKINGVRVRRSTVELFPNAIEVVCAASLGGDINDLLFDASLKMRLDAEFHKGPFLLHPIFLVSSQVRSDGA